MANYVYSAPVREFRVTKMDMKAGKKQTEKSDSVRMLLILRDSSLTLARRLAKYSAGTVHSAACKFK